MTVFYLDHNANFVLLSRYTSIYNDSSQTLTN